MPVTYQTREGPLTEEQIRSGLQGANYPGPWDINSMLGAFQRAGGGGGGGGATYQTQGGFDLAGGYGLIDPAQQALQLLLQTRQQELARYGQMGRTPVVLDPNVDYYDIIMRTWQEHEAKYGRQRDAAGNPPRDLWINLAANVTGLPTEVLAKHYDTVTTLPPSSPARSSKEGWNRTLQQVAQTAIPSLEREQWQALTTGYTPGAAGAAGAAGTPTFLREQWEAAERARQAQFERAGQQWQTETTGYMPGAAGAAGAPTLAREQYQTGAGQALLNLAAQLRGPESYFQYANMLAGAAGSPQLEFARRMTTGQPQAAFGNWGPSQPATLAGLLGGAQEPPGGRDERIVTGEVRRTQTEPQLPVGRAQFQPAGAFQQPPTPQQMLPAIPAPHRVSVRQTAGWTPTQTKMWGSALQAQGYEPEDWFELQRRAAPKGTAAMPRRWA